MTPWKDSQLFSYLFQYHPNYFCKYEFKLQDID